MPLELPIATSFVSRAFTVLPHACEASVHVNGVTTGGYIMSCQHDILAVASRQYDIITADTWPFGVNPSVVLVPLLVVARQRVPPEVVLQVAPHRVHVIRVALGVVVLDQELGRVHAVVVALAGFG